MQSSSRPLRTHRQRCELTARSTERTEFHSVTRPKVKKGKLVNYLIVVTTVPLLLCRR